MRYLYFWLVAALFFCSFSVTGQTAPNKNTPNTAFTIYKYGFISYPQKATYTVAKKYGIHYQAIAGCTITKEVADKAEQHNKEVYAMVENKYGKGFWHRFDLEVNEYLKKQQH